MFSAPTKMNPATMRMTDATAAILQTVQSLCFPCLCFSGLAQAKKKCPYPLLRISSCSTNKFMNALIRKSHNVSILMYHFVFVAKYRRFVISDKVYQILREEFEEISK